jgi:hypothetical protein
VRFGILLSISEAHEQIRNYKNGKDHTRNSVHCHKSDIYSSQVIWFYDGMLVNQTTNKNQNANPVQHTKMSKLSSSNNTGCAK